MGILTTIQGSQIYLDVNIWIYALEQHPLYSQALTELFQQIDQKTLTVVTSELSLAEALVKPMRDQDIARQTKYRQLFSSRSNLRVIPVQRAILIEAARQRAVSSSLKLPDAIHLATAVILKCTTLLTNDQKFKGLSSLPVVILSEVVP